MIRLLLAIAAVGCGRVAFDPRDTFDANAGDATVDGEVICTSTAGYVKAPLPHAGDQFGAQIVLSADATTLAVSAPAEDSAATGIGGDMDDRSSPESGAVFVFRRASCGWSLEAYIKPSVTTAGAQFGNAIALADDGSTLVATSATAIGSAYVFERTGAVWSQAAVLMASNGETPDSFGRSVTISGNGGMIVVGAPGEQSSSPGLDGNQANNGVNSAGAAYSYNREQGWAQTHYIKPLTVVSLDTFGFGVDLDTTASTLVVGVPGQDATGTNSGALVVFTAGGGTWMQRVVLDPSPGGGDLLGVHVAVDGAGSVIATGSSEPAFNENARSFRGGGATWNLQTPLGHPVFETGDQFARALALSRDGTTLVVGSKGDDSPATGLDADLGIGGAAESGAAFVYTGNPWALEHVVKATNTDAMDLFGSSVTASADGSVWAVGAIGEASASPADATNNDAPGAGAVYVYP